MADTLINHTTRRIVLSEQPGSPGILVDAWPDPRAAPHPAAAAQSMLALGLVWSQDQIAALLQRVAALEIAVAESERHREHADAATPEQSRRRLLALALVSARGDALQIGPLAPAASDAPASALDGIELPPSDGGGGN